MANKIKILFFVLFIFLLSSNLYSQDKQQKIDELIKKYNEYGQFNGSALVADKGNVILSKGYGYANIEWKIPNSPDTKFRLGSVTKQFTAMLIMQLAEQGKINLDAKITDYIPYYRKDIGDKITVHQLLTHTSGIPNLTDDREMMQNLIRDPVEVKELVTNYCSAALEFEPGAKWDYSNSGYIILGAIIEEVTGKKYETVLNENILIPLNMTGTGYDLSTTVIENRASGYDKSFKGMTNTKYMDMSIPYAAGAMYSTVEDLRKWDEALYSDKLVSKESKDKIFTPYMGGYGYGWHIKEVNTENQKHKIVTHSGGIFGFNTIIIRFVEDMSLIVLLNNFSSGNLNQLSKGISNILYDQPYDMPKKSLTEIFYASIASKGIAEAINEFNELRKNKDEYSVSEGEINQLGYNLMQTDKLDDAIEVFKLNVEEFPNSFNVYDSLGEAYMNKGEKDLAIMNYKKSIELNPSNEGGKKNLQKLESQ